MALELQQAGRLRAHQEGVVARLVAQEKGNVHARAAIVGHLVQVELRAVDEVVQQLGLGGVAPLHRRHASGIALGLALEPLEGEAGHVDGVGGRCVVHGRVVGHGLVIEGTGADSERVAQQVFAHHDQGQASGT